MTSPTIAPALAQAARDLVAIGPTPRLDAELLMAHALGLSREAMLLGRMDGPVPEGFAALVARRLAHEPVAYITGHRAFWTIELAVAPGVLIPRPDSETLIEAAVAHFEGDGPARILDLGVGSGALLLAALAEWPAATGLGIDRSEIAAAQARANAEALGLADRADIRIGDWADGIDERFDLVLCNPPYVESVAVLAREVADHEPASALYAGPEGLDDYRRLAPMLSRLIAPGGMAAVEIGAGQAAAVLALFAGVGLDGTVRRDLAGRDRCIVLKR
ncbi:peptide chain release factor N(5)-glutamine methyltransferase [Sphingomonas montanisoli]|uniref:Release factor glutamine methyltransferase n=1 Tax=Sphingomonas montanisoli TaxID=2606412 RepID=A0A5D9CBD3_9SPHN|nr:peptide chain release factor N(5)-glutamine methyltransferase [Sphingomonas montanisoli]TZG27375.1 peptide chain release factor N(5)-glutamine methyltransferase [Sphingomonas montanisoli]